MIQKQFDTLTENELIGRIKEGEKELYEILIRRNNPYLYKVGMSYGFNHQDVEDLMQDTFVSAFINLGKFEGRSTFKTWLVRIMLNHCYQKVNKSSHKNEKLMETNFNEQVVPVFHEQQQADALKVVTNKEVSQIIGQALVQIPVDYRMVFCLRELNGMSTAETAEAIGISETNVKVRLNRAKAMLRKEIEKTYTPEDIYEFNLIYCDRIVDAVMKRIYELQTDF